MKARVLRIVAVKPKRVAPACHWHRLHGPMVNGEVTMSVVWLCQYPYPTMTATQPDDCDNCPLHQVMERHAV